MTFTIAAPGRIERRPTPFGEKVLLCGRIKMEGPYKIKNAKLKNAAAMGHEAERTEGNFLTTDPPSLHYGVASGSGWGKRSDAKAWLVANVADGKEGTAGYACSKISQEAGSDTCI